MNNMTGVEQIRAVALLAACQVWPDGFVTDLITRAQIFERYIRTGKSRVGMRDTADTREDLRQSLKGLQDTREDS